jgi:hypothetical protein
MRTWAVPWKLVGLAGLVGVAATGAVVARAERRRGSYSPEEIRERLHARHAEVTSGPAAPAGTPEPGAETPEPDWDGE